MVKFNEKNFLLLLPKISRALAFSGSNKRADVFGLNGSVPTRILSVLGTLLLPPEPATLSISGEAEIQLPRLLD